MSKHKIIFGDSREVMRGIADEAVSLIVTSPPYNVGREYEAFLKDFDDLWRMLDEVFGRECFRIMEPHGKVAINFADKYSSDAHGKGEKLYGQYYNATLCNAGFLLWGRVIWDKNRVFINGATHLAAKSNQYGHMRVAPNWEYIMVWKKESPPPLTRKAVDMTKAERVAWTNSIWKMDSVHSNKAFAGFKLARFPEELPRRLMKMYTQPGDLVLDPFGGTCTTTKVAMALGRDSICIELNKEMKPYIQAYLAEYQDNMFGETAEVEYID